MDNYGAGENSNKYTNDDFNRALGYENSRKDNNSYNKNNDM